MERPTDTAFMEIVILLFVNHGLSMDFTHLYGTKPWHLENRDQVEMCRSLCIWTPNLPLSLAQRPAPGCKLEGQVVCDNHCLLLCLNSPSIRNDIL